MKYAFISFSCPELDIDGMLSVAKSYGYDGIELRVDVKHRHGADTDSDAGARSIF